VSLAGDRERHWPAAHTSQLYVSSCHGRCCLGVTPNGSRDETDAATSQCLAENARSRGGLRSGGPTRFRVPSLATFIVKWRNVFLGTYSALRCRHSFAGSGVRYIWAVAAQGRYDARGSAGLLGKPHDQRDDRVGLYYHRRPIHFTANDGSALITPLLRLVGCKSRI
jgi:hypothetical protein